VAVFGIRRPAPEKCVLCIGSEKMIKYEDMPEDNEKLAKIDIDFPHVPLANIHSPEDLKSDLIEYLEIEDYAPDGEIGFIRTAKVENTVYWIWKFISQGDEVYATVALDQNGNMTIGCDENYYNLTPEQYIIGDYHNCF